MFQGAPGRYNPYPMKLHCHRCSHAWTPRSERRPAVCPNCNSARWDDHGRPATAEPAADLAEVRFLSRAAAFFRAAKPEIRQFIEETMERYTTPARTTTGVVTKTTSRSKKSLDKAQNSGA